MQNLIKYDLRFQFNPVGSLKKVNSQCEADTKKCYLTCLWHKQSKNKNKEYLKGEWNIYSNSMVE